MPTISDVASQVLGVGAPILFLDTCCILDIIREPFRTNNKGSIKAALNLREMCSSSPPECSLVVGSFVKGEWSDHDQKTLADLQKHVVRMDQHASDFHALCADLGINLNFGRPAYSTSGFATQIHKLSSDILHLAIGIDRSDVIELLAYKRALGTMRRPSRQGSELKDCTIFEECLEVCRQLQAGGFGRKMVYCTSNTDDYCIASTSTPHPDIVADCTAVGGLKFTTTIHWALNELKKP